MLKSLHRQAIGIMHDDKVVSKQGYASGGDNEPLIVMPGSPTHAAIWEDFFVNPLVGVGVTDTGGVPVVTDTGLAGIHFIRKTGGTGSTTAIADGTGGVYQVTTTTAGTLTPAGGSKIIGPQLAWKVNQGKGAGAGALRMVARLKKTTYATGMHGISVGFTDVVNTEAPFSDTGDNSSPDKAVATNGFAIMHMTDGDTGWIMIAVDGDTVQETALTTVAPTDNKYVTLEMEAHRTPSDTGGTLSAWIDGVPLGTISKPCNVSTGLAPFVHWFDTGGAANIHIDYINVSAPRDTGL
jgi:hypothetical protein